MAGLIILRKKKLSVFSACPELVEGPVVSRVEPAESKGSAAFLIRQLVLNSFCPS
jgi:hypothetical protein